eukprot:1138237-Pelagomonas_calceolata.AAC.3
MLLLLFASRSRCASWLCVLISLLAAYPHFTHGCVCPRSTLSCVSSLYFCVSSLHSWLCVLAPLLAACPHFTSAYPHFTHGCVSSLHS